MKDLWDYFNSVEVFTTSKSDRIKPFLENMKSAHFNLNKINITLTRRQEVKTKTNCSIFEIGFVKKSGGCCDECCQACNQNQINLVKKAYESGQQNVLIFEDDARWNLPLNVPKIKSAINWLKNNEDKWDTFYFGSMHLLSYPVTKSVLRSHYPALCHAYAVNRTGMKKILDKVTPDWHYDAQIGQMKGLRKYVLYPSLCHQCIAPRDYRKSFINKIISFRTLNTFTDHHHFILMFLLLGFGFFLVRYCRYKIQKYRNILQNFLGVGKCKFIKNQESQEVQEVGSEIKSETSQEESQEVCSETSQEESQEVGSETSTEESQESQEVNNN